jgi:tRNA(fMet)-specific endonuclease VapC
VNELLLDTDTLSLFLRNQPKVMAKANEYLKYHQDFTFSIITRFEILRGLKAKNAPQQISKFEGICQRSKILGLNDKTIVKASDIYADLFNRGQIIGDADILIAATAIVNNLTIVTNNENHFSRILDLRVLNWNK